MRICAALNIGNALQGYHDFVRELYLGGMSGPEIAEYIKDHTQVEISARSIQRIIAKYGETREIKEAFNNAIKKGRVKWQYEEDKAQREARERQLSRGLRWKILERDNFKCQVCGNGKDQGALLQVDHIVAKVFGGSDDEKNLRTLCIDCNVGKKLEKRESRVVGGFQSGE